MRASIRQVAEMASVSPMTVTRVLRGGSVVAEETRLRVLAAVRATDYVPVRSAVQNRHSATNILGLVPYHAEVMQYRLDSNTSAGIFRAARRNGYDLLVMLRGESEWMSHKAASFLDRRSDGFVFNSAGRGEWQTVLETLAQQKVPVVVCYRRDVPEGIAWVDPDNDAIIEQAVHALIRCGHQRIAYLTMKAFSANEPDHHLPHQQAGGNFDDTMRRTAFERVSRETGVDGAVMENPRLDWTFEPAILDSLVARGITGVVCVNDIQALQLWEVAEARGFRIPKDLSIIGVDDGIAEAATRGLTSLTFGYETVGEAAVDAWVALVGGSPAEDCCRVVPVRMVERQSVAPPR